MYANMIMGDIAWLDVQRIRGDNNIYVSERLEDEFNVPAGVKRKRGDFDESEQRAAKLDGG